MTLITPPRPSNTPVSQSLTTYHIETTLEEGAPEPRGFNATLERPTDMWVIDITSMGTAISRVLTRATANILNHSEHHALRMALRGSHSYVKPEELLTDLAIEYRVQGWNATKKEPATPKTRCELYVFFRVLDSAGTILLGDTRILAHHDARVKKGCVVSKQGCRVRPGALVI